MGFGEAWSGTAWPGKAWQGHFADVDRADASAFADDRRSSVDGLGLWVPARIRAACGHGKGRLMSRYERLAGLRPANRTTAIVAGARGTHWNEQANFGQLHSDVPISTYACPDWAEDLTGRKFGRLTVIGFRCGNEFKGALWVVRCVCGAYETRRSKAISKAINSEICTACCKACARLHAIKLRGSNVKRK